MQHALVCIPSDSQVVIGFPGSSDIQFASLMVAIIRKNGMLAVAKMNMYQGLSQ